MTKTQWTIQDITSPIFTGEIEFQDNKGEWQHFELVATKKVVVFGGSTNNSFLQSGFIERDDCESLDETLQEMLSDLETYYNDGHEYVSRIVCNERM